MASSVCLTGIVSLHLIRVGVDYYTAFYLELDKLVSNLRY